MSSTEVDSDDSQSLHLLVLIHGMWGNPDHLLKMRQIMEEKRAQEDSERGPNGERLHILVAETNKDNGTYDGIDWGGERVAKEVSIPSVCSIENGWRSSFWSTLCVGAHRYTMKCRN